MKYGKPSITLKVIGNHFCGYYVYLICSRERGRRLQKAQEVIKKSKRSAQLLSTNLSAEQSWYLRLSQGLDRGLTKGQQGAI